MFLSKSKKPAPVLLTFITITLSVLLNLGCSSLFDRRSDQNDPQATQSPPQTAEAIAAVAELNIKSNQTSHNKAHDSVQPTAEHNSAPKQQSSQHESHHSEVQGISPDKSLGWLKNGNTRFTKGFLRADGLTKKDVSRLAAGQSPHAIVLSCSDSRVPPEIVFDQKLGEIFVVRTAGQSLNANVIGSIEYALEHLGSRLIVVMGHTSCGAVKAAMMTMDGLDAGSPALNQLVQDIHPRLASFKGKTRSENGEPEGWANTEGVAQDLIARSEIVASKVRSGHVKIVSALYHLDSGKVDFKP